MSGSRDNFHGGRSGRYVHMEKHPNRTINVELSLPSAISEKLAETSERTGCRKEVIVERALRKFLLNHEKRNAVYLSAPINALVEGFYVENTTVAEIRRRGDFGLGTFNYLDGEMVILDGEVFQIRSDGRVYSVGDGEGTPFACVTFFRADTFDDIEVTETYKDLNVFLDRLIPSENMLYAIRIDGTFHHVKTRVAPKSENYVPLVEATKNQPLFDFYGVEGCLAGFYTPRFLESLHAPGYHIHFLTADRKRGGHVIGCQIKKARIGIQHVPELELGLPVTLDFLTADLARDISQDLDKAEK